MKNSNFNMIIIALAICFYVLYKISGRPIASILAVAMLIIAGIYRFIYDLRHDSFPWKKARKARNEGMKNILLRRETDEDERK